MAHIAVGWLLSVSLSVDDVLFKLVIWAGAVGWQLEVALMVSVGLFRLEFRSVDVGWQWWLSCVMVDVLLLWVVSDGLFIGIVGIVGGSGFADLSGVAD